MTASTSKIRALRPGRKPWPKRRPPIARLATAAGAKPPQVRARRAARVPERCQ